MSLYDVLGASPDADHESLRRAFVAMARRFHPDRHVGAPEDTRREAEQRMREITEAWSVLGDPNRRSHYDLGLADPVARRSRTTPRAQPGPPRPTAPAAPSGHGSAEARDWRAYASPGPGGASAKPIWEQLLLISPMLLLFTAGVFGLFGAIVGWPPFFVLALICVLLAAAAFFMLPLWAMTRARTKQSGRGPRRSY